MNRSDFHTLFTYSDNCWALFGEVLPEAPEAWDAPFETTSTWNSVHTLLAHCIGAEERIVTLRLKNLPLPVSYEDRAAAGWTGLYEDHKTVRAVTYSYIKSLADAQFEETVPGIAGRTDVTRADMLFHILNHENYHRGQVISALQRLGIDPPNFDYILLK
jgi:uncharacterized damage-inducible protein DinB